ncbi:hypothetical protein [Campylobacter troglodytis]|uniref:hypothetical protein n=1 Tax=Campylobacter troglodytis TaxID=654363 RepID=UPI00163B7EC6|nr:hypothetical protein [Campylobacter troglodytis]
MITQLELKKLTLDEASQVVGGYLVASGVFSDYSLGGVRITESMAIAVPTALELDIGGICDMGVKSSCFIPGSYEVYGELRHYTTSKEKFKELMLVTNNDPRNKFVAFTVKRTLNLSNPYRPSVYYTTGAALVGLSGGRIYKIKSNIGSNKMVKEMGWAYERQLKNEMGF